MNSSDVRDFKEGSSNSKQERLEVRLCFRSIYKIEKNVLLMKPNSFLDKVIAIKNKHMVVFIKNDLTTKFNVRLENTYSYKEQLRDKWRRKKSNIRTICNG